MGGRWPPIKGDIDPERPGKCTRKVDGTQGVVGLGCMSERMWQEVLGVWKRGY